MIEVSIREVEECQPIDSLVTEDLLVDAAAGQAANLEKQFNHDDPSFTDFAAAADWRRGWSAKADLSNRDL